MLEASRNSLRLAGRTVFVLACAFILVRSIRMGMADRMARSGQPAAIATAIAMEPGNDAWPARRAVLRFERGDDSASVEKELREAYARRPGDSSVQMALGLL